MLNWDSPSIDFKLSSNIVGSKPSHKLISSTRCSSKQPNYQTKSSKYGGSVVIDVDDETWNQQKEIMDSASNWKYPTFCRGNVVVQNYQGRLFHQLSFSYLCFH